MMWVFVALASIELAVTHMLLAFWWPLFALILSVVSGCGLIWLLLAIRSFRTRPILLTNEMLIMRTGSLREVRVARAHVSGLRKGWTSEDLKARDVLGFALIAYPNVLVELSEPVIWRGRPYRALAHKLDDPDAFRAALARLDAPTEQRHRDPETALEILL